MNLGVHLKSLEPLSFNPCLADLRLELHLLILKFLGWLKIDFDYILTTFFVLITKESRKYRISIYFLNEGPEEFLIGEESENCTMPSILAKL